MRGKIAIVAFGVSVAALAAEPPQWTRFDSRYLEEQRAAAQARQDRQVERSELIAKRAIASICDGCLGLRYTRQVPSPSIRTEELVAAPALRQTTSAERRQARENPTARANPAPTWKTILLAHLIRD